MDQQIRMGKFLNILLLLIVVAGFLIRIWNISTNPPEFFSDEIASLLSARNILDTGHDINGKFQLYFYNRLELGAPVYGYLAAGVSYVFGENAFSGRLPAVIFGTLTIPLVYVLTKKLFQNEMSAVAASFVIAFSPWGIHFSRVGWQPSILISFIIIPILLFKKFVDEDSKKYLLLSYISFAFVVYTNTSAEFLSPCFLILLNLIYWKKIVKHIPETVFGVLIYLILLTPFFYTLLTQPLLSARSLGISTFAKGINIDSINIFFRNYISYLSPRFLFISGDPNLRHGAGTGVLFWSFLPLILAGFVWLIKNIKKVESIFLLAWLFIFPLGGSLTNDGYPHATRTLIGLPVFAIIAGLGLMHLKNRRPKLFKPIGLVLAITCIFELVNFSKIYFAEYPIKSQGWWDYGQKEVLETVKNSTTGSESLCLTNLNYWHEETLTKFYLGVSNKYKIIYDESDPNCYRSQIIVVDPGVMTLYSSLPFKTVYDLNGKPIWNIYKNAK